MRSSAGGSNYSRPMVSTMIAATLLLSLLRVSLLPVRRASFPQGWRRRLVMTQFDLSASIFPRNSWSTCADALT